MLSQLATLYTFLFIIFIIQVNSQDIQSFEDFIVKYGKQYTQEEKIFRKSIYDERVAKFSEIKFCEPGVNNMTDWTQYQISARKGAQVEINSEDIIISSSITKSPSVSSSYPSSLDWRTKNAVTSIKNQANCGDCWAFATVGYYESKLIINANFSQSLDLSEQYLLECTSGSTCNGGTMKDPMRVASSGVPYESSYPYNPFGWASGTNIPNICSARNKAVLPDGMTTLYTQLFLEQQRLIQLLQKQPIPTAISADGWQYYKSGTIFSCPTGASINHEVLIVGYTPTYWIIKNQWGTSWGEGGYMKLTRSSYSLSPSCYIGNQVAYLGAKSLALSIMILLIMIISI